MAAAIKAKLGVEAEKVPGARGAFEVTRDGRLVFSKLAAGRFPDSDQEILDLL